MPEENVVHVLPARYLTAVKETLTVIDLDPYCNGVVNLYSDAYIVHIDKCSLDIIWAGNVCMNLVHAGVDDIKAYVAHLIRGYTEIGYKRIPEYVVFASDQTQEKWYHDLLSVSSAMCLLFTSIDFGIEVINPSPNQTVFYGGYSINDFSIAFNKLGNVVRLQ